MAKKKKDSELIKIQKLANKSQEKIQKMINSANTLTAQYNATEAEKARLFNAAESATARQFNADEARVAREFNAAEAAKTRDYEKMMSDTSHQREVADLQAAGLNPVLSANGGAMSYTGASANAQAASTSALAGASASASFESGASSAASIMGNLLSGISSLFGSRTAAKATKYAADKSSSATRYAADQAAAATRYAANMAYRSVMDKPQDSVLALADKYLGQRAKQKLEDGSARSQLSSLLRKGYTVARDSGVIENILDSMGVNLRGLNNQTSNRLRSAALDMFIYGSAVPFSSRAKKKYQNGLNTIRSFKKYRSGR